jgi:ABC-2 type transport system permease protein
MSARASAFAAGLRCEARQLGRDRAVWLALLALAGAILFALAAGATRVESRKAIIAAARAEETQRISGLKNSLVQRLRAEAEGKALPDPPYYRDPRNAVFMGGGPAARVAALADAPLALIAVGQSDLLPPVVKVVTDSRETFLFADEIENPSRLMIGATDLAFVIVFVYPLIVIAFACNLLAHEREQGVLAMTLASARRPGAVLAGKFAARAGAPILAALVATTVGLAVFVGPHALQTTEFPDLLLLITLFGLFWAALAAAVDSLGRSSAFNAVAAIGVFTFLTMIGPAALNSLAAFVYPAPSRIDMVLAARAASIDAEQNRDASLARFVEEHGSAGPKGRAGLEATRKRLATREAAFERVEAVVAAHDAQLARQRSLSDRLAFLSPPLLASALLADIAGTGEARYAQFNETIRVFHGDWRRFFGQRSAAGDDLTPDDYDALPRFPEISAAIAPLAIGGFIGVAAPALLLAAFAARGFARPAPH